MRYRISKPPTALTTERNPQVAMAQRGARVRAQVERQVPRWKELAAALTPPNTAFSPLAWPGTARDVAWSSTPVFARAPAGWYRAGFHA
jgi:hypothetical protein